MIYVIKNINKENNIMIYGNKFNNAFAEEAMVDPIEFMAVDLMEMSMFEHVSESALDDIETDSLNESYIIEYTGNETRNEEYRECLKKLDELIQLYIKRIKSVQAIFDKMVALYMTINKKNIGLIIVTEFGTLLKFSIIFFTADKQSTAITLSC